MNTVILGVGRRFLPMWPACRTVEVMRGFSLYGPDAVYLDINVALEMLPDWTFCFRTRGVRNVWPGYEAEAPRLQFWFAPDRAEHNVYLDLKQLL